MIVFVFSQMLCDNWRENAWWDRIAFLTWKDAYAGNWSPHRHHNESCVFFSSFSHHAFEFLLFVWDMQFCVALSVVFMPQSSLSSHYFFIYFPDIHMTFTKYLNFQERIDMFVHLSYVWLREKEMKKKRKKV